MTVVALPVWKAGATAEERFLELAHLAREKPERFTKVVVIYQEVRSGGDFRVQYVCNGCTSLEALGLFDAGAYMARKWIFEHD